VSERKLVDSQNIDLDELAVIGLEPETWYSFVRVQLDLLRAHVQGLEKQIDESIRAYAKEKIATDFERDVEGYPIVILEEHRGIETTPNDLETIFEYYFPNLQRRSSLIILFSFLEHQLDQLCELFAGTRQLSVVHTDLKDKGVNRSRGYLKKVIRLPLDDNSPVWQELKRMQKLRNLIVHNDAKLTDADSIKYVDKTQHLSLASKSYFYDGDTDEIDILEGYLTYVIDIFDSYCCEVNKSMGYVTDSQ
jgi:hypothetical protein